MTKQTGRASGQNFPRASLDESLPHLRRPPAPEAVRFKIQNTAGDHAEVAAYVDARLVFDRLDLVCGGRWTARFEELPSPLVPPPCERDGQPLARPPIHVRCRLTAFAVTRGFASWSRNVRLTHGSRCATSGPVSPPSCTTSSPTRSA